MRRRLALPLVLAIAGCLPSFDARPSDIDEETIIAVVASPPEASPGTEVTVRAIVASPTGPREAMGEWGVCRLPPQLGDQSSAPDSCLRGAVQLVAERAPAATFVVPADACATFGPQITSGDQRARDADETGGYFLPLRVRIPSSDATGGVRLTCARSDIPADAVRELERTAQPNENPAVTLEDDLGGQPAVVHAGDTVRLRARWPAAARERYAMWDPTQSRITTRSEVMHVSWYAARGSWSRDKTHVPESDALTWSENTWSAPAEPGYAHLWVVLRDGRGGVAVYDHGVTVTE